MAQENMTKELTCGEYCFTTSTAFEVTGSGRTKIDLLLYVLFKVFYPDIVDVSSALLVLL